jgi:hypothetical protein
MSNQPEAAAPVPIDPKLVDAVVDKLRPTLREAVAEGIKGLSVQVIGNSISANVDGGGPGAGDFVFSALIGLDRRVLKQSVHPAASFAGVGRGV